MNVIIGINGFVWNGTLAIAGLIFAFSWGYNLARAYGVNDLAGGIVGLATLIQGISFGPALSAALDVNVPSNVADAINSSEIGATIADGTLSVGLWGWLKLDHLNGNAYFTVMIMGAISVIIFCKLMLANITIKMPDSVPPAVSKAFAAILPATIALYVIAIINYIVGRVADGQLIIDLVQKYIAEPFLGLSQGLGAVLIVTVFVQVFWFFGIHGPNVLAPVLEGIWGQAQLINIDIFQKGYNGKTGTPAVLDAIEDGKAYMWVRGSFDAFAWFGGSGGTIVLLIAILIFSKRADYLTVAKLSIGPDLQYQRTSDVWSANRIECNHVYPILDCSSSSNSNWMDSYLSWPSRSGIAASHMGSTAVLIVILSNRCGLAGTDRNISMYGRDFLDLGTICHLCKQNGPCRRRTTIR